MDELCELRIKIATEINTATEYVPFNITRKVSSCL